MRGTFDFVVVTEGEANDALILRIRKSAYLVNRETVTVFESFPLQETS